MSSATSLTSDVTMSSSTSLTSDVSGVSSLSGTSNVSSASPGTSDVSGASASSGTSKVSSASSGTSQVSSASPVTSDVSRTPSYGGFIVNVQKVLVITRRVTRNYVADIDEDVRLSLNTDHDEHLPLTTDQQARRALTYQVRTGSHYWKWTRVVMAVGLAIMISLVAHTLFDMGKCARQGKTLVRGKFFPVECEEECIWCIQFLRSQAIALIQKLQQEGKEILKKMNEYLLVFALENYHV
uniref:Uncharacterized protein n=1 Tax=Lygus hesperus TaxID=30085 RepID=A0A0K8SY79_LYGHE